MKTPKQVETQTGIVTVQEDSLSHEQLLEGRQTQRDCQDFEASDLLIAALFQQGPHGSVGSCIRVRNSFAVEQHSSAPGWRGSSINEKMTDSVVNLLPFSQLRDLERENSLPPQKGGPESWSHCAAPESNTRGRQRHMQGKGRENPCTLTASARTLA